MRYAASIDASIFRALSFDFDGTTLSSLERMPAGSILILTDLTIIEIKKQWTKQLLEASANIKRRAGQRWFQMAIDVEPSIKDDATIELAVDERMGGFLSRTGAVTIPISHSAITSAMSLYRKSLPPFGDGKKENEFKDALILTTLLEYATQHNLDVIIASADNDWEGFAEKREMMHHVTSVSELLDRLQRVDRDVRSSINTFVRAREDDILQKILDNSAFYVSFPYAGPYETESVEISIKSQEWSVYFEDKSDESLVSIVERHENRARVSVEVVASAQLILDVRRYQQDPVSGHRLFYSGSVEEDTYNVLQEIVIDLHYEDGVYNRFELINPPFTWSGIIIPTRILDAVVH